MYTFSPPLFSLFFVGPTARRVLYCDAAISFRVYFVLVYSILSHLLVCLPVRMPDLNPIRDGFEPLSQLRTDYPHP